jgi:threonine/homoserine/homoserine lactone efflux protein
VIGVAALFSQMASLMIGVRLLGAAYLAYLAYRSFRTAIYLPPVDLKSKAPLNGTRTALAGYVMQISNPKAIFFWLAVAAAGGVGNAPLPIIALFVAGAFVNSFLGHGVYALLLSSTPFRTAYGRARRWIEGTLGVFFTFFAFKLATDRG